MQQGFSSLTKNIPGNFRRYLFSAFTGNLSLPIYALFVPLLASREGASLFEIGIVGGASNAVYSFLPFIMGRFSDRKGSRKFFIVASFLVLTIVSASYAFISIPIYLIVARVFEGIGWAMLWPAMDAAVSKDVESIEPKKAFSLYNATWSCAAALGPLIGSAFIFLTSIRDSFFLTVFIMGITSVVNLVPLLKGNDGKKKYSEKLEQRAYSKSEITRLPVNSRGAPGYAFYGAACALASVSSGVLFTFFASYGRSIGISILLIGLITFSYGFVRFLFYLLTINEQVRYALLRQDKRVRNMILALAMTSVSSLIVSFRDPTGFSYIAAYGVVGVGISIVFAIAQAGMIAESSPDKYGRSAGLFESSIGFGACFGPIIGGAISGSSLAVPFIVPPIGFVIFLAAFPLITRRSR
jgi:MFS family permease